MDTMDRSFTGTELVVTCCYNLITVPDEKYGIYCVVERGAGQAVGTS